MNPSSFGLLSQRSESAAKKTLDAIIKACYVTGME
jgi:hypothetical protein